MRKYYQENKEHKKRKNASGYKDNRDERIKDQREYYQKNRLEILGRAKGNRKVKRQLINFVAMYYGCQNQQCKWNGEFHYSQLEFHHFQPEFKKFQLGRGADYSYKGICTEINKCIVLCACCHALHHAGYVELDKSMLCKVNEKLEIINETK